MSKHTPRSARRRALLRAAAAIAFLACVPGIAATKPPRTTLVSVKSTGAGGANSDSFQFAISADARVVAFSSGATDITASPDDNSLSDVFVRDLTKPTASLVTIDVDGEAGNFGGSSPSVTPDGRLVAFESDSLDLVPATQNLFTDVHVRDLSRGTTTRVSTNLLGTADGNNDSRDPVLSANGRFVVFRSIATDLVADDGNNREDVFVHDLKTRVTTLVSVNLAGTASGNGDSAGPLSISANGRFVAFVSSASNLVATDTNGARDVFVRDVKKGVTSLASMNSAGTDSGNMASFSPAMTPNGRFVSFISTAVNLVNEFPGSAPAVFVRDVKKRTTRRAATEQFGIDAQHPAPPVSANGRFVAFVSTEFEAFRTDLRTGIAVRASSKMDGEPSGTVTSVAMSADGRWVAFISASGEHVTGDTNARPDAFVRDLLKGNTILLSANADATGAGNGDTLDPIVLSANGRSAAFTSRAGNLVGNDGNGRRDVFVRQFR